MMMLDLFHRLALPLLACWSPRERNLDDRGALSESIVGPRSTFHEKAKKLITQGSSFLCRSKTLG